MRYTDYMKKKLSVGQTAPFFEATDVNSQAIRLTDDENKHTLVVFLRYAGCPYCNLALHRLTLEAELLKENRCRVVAFIQSSQDNIVKNIYKQKKES